MLQVSLKIEYKESQFTIWQSKTLSGKTNAAATSSMKRDAFSHAWDSPPSNSELFVFSVSVLFHVFSV